jgi:class 3 adenylate cyclase
MNGAHHKHAVDAGMELLAATGHGSGNEPWVSIGVGVHSGTAFVGSISAANGNHQFSALGDVMNFGARLVANAEPGELLMSEIVWNDVKGERECQPRTLEFKGYGPAAAYSARLRP